MGLIYIFTRNEVMNSSQVRLHIITPLNQRAKNKKDVRHLKRIYNHKHKANNYMHQTKILAQPIRE